MACEKHFFPPTIRKVTVFLFILFPNAWTAMIESPSCNLNKVTRLTLQLFRVSLDWNFGQIPLSFVMFCIKGIVLPRSRYEPISFSWNVMSGLCCRCSSIPFLPGLGLRTTTASTKRWLKAFWRALSWTNIQLGSLWRGGVSDFFSRSFLGVRSGSSLILDPHPSVFFLLISRRGSSGGSKNNGMMRAEGPFW